MPETCKNGHGLVNSCGYYTFQTPEVNQVLPYSMDLKAPSGQANAVLFGINKYPNTWNHVNIWSKR